ncbi:MAG: alpha-N-acetylglucosaminidase, partial [Prevotella sp.]|nr:alpha-N-acetylglucosaminidase [Prevotella sp.]
LSKQMAHNSSADFQFLNKDNVTGKTMSELIQLAMPIAPSIDWYAIEEPWTLQHNTYSSAPEGNSVDVAKEVMQMIDRQ